MQDNNIQVLLQLQEKAVKLKAILEISPIVHDIACPICRERYGNIEEKE